MDAPHVDLTCGVFVLRPTETLPGIPSGQLLEGDRWHPRAAACGECDSLWSARRDSSARQFLCSLALEQSRGPTVAAGASGLVPV